MKGRSVTSCIGASAVSGRPGRRPEGRCEARGVRCEVLFTTDGHGFRRWPQRSWGGEAAIKPKPQGYLAAKKHRNCLVGLTEVPRAPIGALRVSFAERFLRLFVAKNIIGLLRPWALPFAA